MNKGVTFLQALFLILFACKGLQLRLFGHVPSWLVVASPFLFSIIYDGLEAYFKSRNVSERLRFFLWKRMVNKKAKDAGKTAAKDMKQYLNKTANPGQAYDTK